jgi:YesN/AraC family two-component response regulator
LKPTTERDYHERIVRTLIYIQQHLDDELELEDLASPATFSPRFSGLGRRILEGTHPPPAA